MILGSCSVLELFLWASAMYNNSTTAGLWTPVLGAVRATSSDSAKAC